MQPRIDFGTDVDDNASSAASATPPVTSQLELFKLTAGLIGLQYCWAVQVGYVTKSLLELGLSQRFVSYAWLAGPIAGIIVQPTVGILSDRCTSPLGRRRPFLIGGALFSIACLLLFAYAEDIGRVLGDAPDAKQKTSALTVAIGAFWALDFSINAAQGPLRALLADVVHSSQHKQGNSFFALATGIGNCMGSFLGSLKLATLLPIFRTDIQALFSSAVLVLVVCMGCTVISVKETPLVASGPTSNATDYESTEFTQIHHASLPDARNVSASSSSLEPDEPETITFPWSFIDAALIAPKPFWPTFYVQCCTWFGWFTLFVFGTSWVGADVMNGSFTADEGTRPRELYDHGVRLGNLGLALQSVVTILISPVLPSLIRTMGPQQVYVLASLSLSAALGSALFLHNPWQVWMAVVAIASTGFAWAVTMTLPWSLMGEAVAINAPAKAGIYYTMFNLSQCFPEVLVSVVAEEVERITGRQYAVLVLGSVALLFAIGLILFLKVGIEDDFRQVGNEDGEDVEVTTSLTDENHAVGNNGGIVVEKQCA